MSDTPKRLGDIAARDGKRHALLGHWTVAENMACWRRWQESGFEGLGVPHKDATPELKAEVYQRWREKDPLAPKGRGQQEHEPEANIGEKQTADLDAHLTYIGMPEVTREVLRQGVEERPVVKAVRDWWRTQTRLALLYGESGAGKTVAACVPFLYAKQPQFWDSGKCGFISADELARLSYFGAESEQLLRQLSRVRLLVLDDLGAELASDGWKSTLDKLITDREGRKGCRTVITTNLSARRPGPDKASPFEERYGARVARRIRESGKVICAERSA